ncbi:peptide methionine sulfoxide reductase, partial [Halorubrum sp. AD140]|nr:peptide methionine sulfoxide reductase [Halorubrum sp. AD140]
HQKYKLRSVSSLMDAFEATGYGDEELRESPIAAKLNGYAAGHDVGVAEELPTPDRRTA